MVPGLSLCDRNRRTFSDRSVRSETPGSARPGHIENTAEVNSVVLPVRAQARAPAMHQRATLRVEESVGEVSSEEMNHVDWF